MTSSCLVEAAFFRRISTFSECSAVGSVPVLGIGGRMFKSYHSEIFLVMFYKNCVRDKLLSSILNDYLFYVFCKENKGTKTVFIL